MKLAFLASSHGELVANNILALARARRSEAEAAMKSGGCGNCAKGDAFRCAGCPSRGLPAWKTADGGAVTIDLGMDS